MILKMAIMLCKIIGRDPMKYKIKLLRKRGVVVGKKCRIFSEIATSEPYLITIKDGVTISTDVKLITHDNSIIKASAGKYTDLFGKIEIGTNSFIGASAIILPGVELAEGTIVAAGSVVTKSVTDKNAIIAGNPARIVGSHKEFLSKNKKSAFNCSKLNKKARKMAIIDNEDKLIKRRPMDNNS